MRLRLATQTANTAAGRRRAVTSDVEQRSDDIGNTRDVLSRDPHGLGGSAPRAGNAAAKLVEGVSERPRFAVWGGR